MAGHEDGSSIEAVGFSEIFIGGGVGSGIASTVVVLVSCGTDGRVCTWEANTFKLRATGIHEVSFSHFFFERFSKSILFLPSIFLITHILSIFFFLLHHHCFRN